MKFRMALLVFWTLLRTVFRRVLLGPLRPGWTWGTELVLETSKRVLQRLGRVEPSVVRRLNSAVDTRKEQWPSIQVTPVDAHGVVAHWFEPAGAPADRALMYLHGGGYVVGSVHTHRELLNRLARDTGLRVLAVDYRLAPEHPHPAALEDARAAFAWLQEQGVRADQVVLGGDSAGGGLALALLVSLRDERAAMPRAAVCFSPWTDLAGTGDSMRLNGVADYLPTEQLVRVGRLYAGDAGVTHPTVSPLYADLRGLPPLLLQAGAAEVLLDDSVRFAERARDAGVTVTLEVDPDMFHVHVAFAGVAPQGRAALARAVAFIRNALAP